uniref:Uncharacterized protein n=1 Tax=Panagrolaimus sp. JU765 TaxID=591449 RepID=A0AC34Q783_9BILA
MVVGNNVSDCPHSSEYYFTNVKCCPKNTTKWANDQCLGTDEINNFTAKLLNCKKTIVDLTDEKELTEVKPQLKFNVSYFANYMKKNDKIQTGCQNETEIINVSSEIENFFNGTICDTLVYLNNEIKCVNGSEKTIVVFHTTNRHDLPIVPDGVDANITKDYEKYQKQGTFLKPIKRKKNGTK